MLEDENYYAHESSYNFLCMLGTSVKMKVAISLYVMFISSRKTNNRAYLVKT